MSKYVPKVGDTGTFYPGNSLADRYVHGPISGPGAKPQWAKIVKIWSDTCVNLECETGLPTSVLVVDPCATAAPPSGYYFVPDVKAAADPIEAEIQAKGLTAPRVTPDAIEANIVGEFYFTAQDGAGKEVGHPALELLTFCVLILRNGFAVTGESACASPKNFDAEVGRKVARANAVNKVWPLMGYELKSQLAKDGA